MQIEATELERFLSLRRDLFAAIKECLELDGHCKSYEGAFRVSFLWPNYFEVADALRLSGELDDAQVGPVYQIALDCYLVGPSRHYAWEGATFGDALTKCESDVRRWIAESKWEEESA